MTIAGGMAALGGLVLAVNLICIALGAVRLMRARRPSPLSRDLPPVTLVRPLRGIEAFSRETLEAGFRLDHPVTETIFCVADADDPIVPMIHDVAAQFPEADWRIVTGDEKISANPKLNNCVRGWRAAKHEWVVIADSNVLMPADYIARMMESWAPDTGLVCSTPQGSRPDGFWAEVEIAFLNTLQARWQYAGEAVGLGFAQGKSMLWNKPFLDANGGIEALGAEIAEDAAATKLVRRAGRHVHLVGQPFEQPLGSRRPQEVVQRQYRWAKLRRSTFLPLYAAEIFTSALVPALMIGFGYSPAAGVAALALWYGAELAMIVSLRWCLSRRTLLAFLARDLVLPLIWAYAFIGRNVSWRGNAMTIDQKNARLNAAETPSDKGARDGARQAMMLERQ